MWRPLSLISYPSPRHLLNHHHLTIIHMHIMHKGSNPRLCVAMTAVMPECMRPREMKSTGVRRSQGDLLVRETGVEDYFSTSPISNPPHCQWHVPVLRLNGAYVRTSHLCYSFIIHMNISLHADATSAALQVSRLHPFDIKQIYQVRQFTVPPILTSQSPYFFSSSTFNSTFSSHPSLPHFA